MRFLPMALLLSAFVIASNLHGDTSNCAPDFSSCSVYEDGLTLSFRGFIAAAGDVIIEDSSGTVSDVFRIFNDFFDTGGGTGLGGTAFLYSADEGDLPDPSTYSVNAVFVPEGPDIGAGLTETVYVGGFGTEFDIFSKEASGVPEPSTLWLLGLGAGAVVWQRRRTSRGVDTY